MKNFLVKYFYVLIFLIIAQCIQLYSQSKVDTKNYNALKSLSKEHIEGLLNGESMGMAKAAELNGYPGPRQILDYIEELKLNDNQVDQLRLIYVKEKEEAIKLGRSIIDEERKLNELFSNKTANPQNLEDNLIKIAVQNGKLRYVHLKAHYEARKLLSEKQINLYYKIKSS
ncbi:MAG: hypothetical protein AB1775_09780 [Bacteroidota bacterium]